MVFKKFLKKRRSSKSKPQEEQPQLPHQQEQQQAVPVEAPSVALPQHEVNGEFRRIIDKINSNIKKLSSSTMTDEQGSDLALFHRDEIVVGKKLGSGGFSDVYEIESFETQPQNDTSLSLYQSLARDTIATTCNAGEVKYALKHLRPKMTENNKKFCMAAADLVIEAKFLAEFNHPHILGIRGWTATGTEGYSEGSHDGYFLIVERLYETLEQRMERWAEEGISDDDLLYECVRIGSQIASALEYLHAKNIIFRDIKPNNIGFDANNDIKIFDLGLCRELPSGEKTTDAVFKMSGRVGTLRYMSPECAMSEHYGVSSDVYGFSMVLYEMMNRGQKPFEGYSRQDHLDKTCKAGVRPVVNESWPIMIQDLLERAWSPTIEERPSMAEIASRLQDVMMDLMDGRDDEERSIVFSGIVESPSTEKLIGEDRTGSFSDFSEYAFSGGELRSVELY